MVFKSKSCGAGLAIIGIASAGVGVGIVFGCLVFIQKRTFFRAIREKMYHAERQFPPLNRNMTTWRTCTRIEDPKISKHLSLCKDPETGYEIMSAWDFSGKNHYLLTDVDFKSEIYYKIFGSFSTSSTSFNGKTPLMVDSHTLEGQSKPQFFHHYDVPKLIKKIHVELNDMTIETLNSDQLKQFLATLKSETN